MIKLSEKEFITAPPRQIPVVTNCDVLVCGGGPAGSAAALSAARCGADVVLIESAGCLGGVLTSGLLSWLIDCDKNGIMKEILDEIRNDEKIADTKTSYTCYSQPEMMKRFLEKKCLETGVRIRLHTTVSGVITHDDKITYVLTESKSASQAHRAEIYIDCTGDGDLGALAGCGFDIGRQSDNAIQPMSMIAVLTGIKFKEVHEFTAHVGSKSPYDKLLAEIRRANINPSYTRPTLYHLGNDIFSLASNHQYCNAPIDSETISNATLKARQEINAQIDGLHSLGGIWRNIQLIATSSAIGIREGRRIHGRYKVSLNDLINGRQHKDAVCNVNFGIDIHSVNDSEGKSISSNNIKTRPYQIPLRALQSKDIHNLMMAGRCISGDFHAHSSYRVCGNAIAMGEAAGHFAALNENNFKKYKTFKEVVK